MTRASPRRLQELFDAALGMADAERREFLETSCGADLGLRREVESLVAAARAAPDFLERPAAELELEGRRAGPWRIGPLISSGGMADVHSATRADTDLPWRVAIKVLRRELDGEAFVRRFHEERRTLAALAHPNIVSLIDAGTLADGRPYLATELVSGRPIDRHCEENRLDLAARIRLLISVCDAVDHAHRRMVVHCDLKPENVLVTAEGNSKLLDFGVARLLAAETSGERHGCTPAATSAPWTPGYASPELMSGGPVGCASDVWSLGVLLFEVCAGRRAFAVEGRSRAEVESAAQIGEFSPDAARARQTLPAELAEIVALAVAVDPERRYPTAAALAADLRAFVDSRPVAAHGGGVPYRLRKLARRHRVTSAALVLAGVSFACAAFAMWRNLEFARADARTGWAAHAQVLAVARFLEGLALDAAEPAALAVALDRAARRLDAMPALPLESEARIRTALAELDLRLGRTAQATLHLRRALDLATHSPAFDADDLLRLRSLLAPSDGTSH